MKRQLLFLLISLSTCLFTGCKEKNPAEYSSDNSSSSSSSSNSSSSSDDRYDIYGTDCIKIVVSNSAGSGSKYSATAYLWEDRSSGKKILSQSRYSLNIISTTIKNNTSSSSYGYSVSKYDYYCVDYPTVGYTYHYYFNTGSKVGTGGSSSSSSSNSDSDNNTSSTSTCSYCNGTGKCSHCNGTGYTKPAPFAVLCSWCLNGKCMYCNGKGYR